MLDRDQKKRYEERFSSIESSFRIEGMDPSGDAIYRSAKAQVLAGTLTPKEALAFVLKQSANGNGSGPLSHQASSI